MAQPPLLGQDVLVIEASRSHSDTRTTLGRTPLDEWSTRRSDLYLTTYNNHKILTPMPPLGFEPAIPAREGPQTHALDRAAAGIGRCSVRLYNTCVCNRIAGQTHGQQRTGTTLMSARYLVTFKPKMESQNREKWAVPMSTILSLKGIWRSVACGMYRHVHPQSR
jgi:hypothetical protein